MPSTIHTSMASTFQCEHCHVLPSKYEIKVTLKCTQSHGGVYGQNSEWYNADFGHVGLCWAM